MQKIMDAIKFYQKQEKDLQKASRRNMEAFASSTPARRRNMQRIISACQEAKERAFWHVVEMIKQSELGPVLARVPEEDLARIKSFNGRYLPPAQAAGMALSNLREVKNER